MWVFLLTVGLYFPWEFMQTHLWPIYKKYIMTNIVIVMNWTDTLLIYKYEKQAAKEARLFMNAWKQKQRMIIKKCRHGIHLYFESSYHRNSIDWTHKDKKEKAHIHTSGLSARAL